jgi:hypothetical protein
MHWLSVEVDRLRDGQLPAQRSKQNRPYNFKQQRQK